MSGITTRFSKHPYSETSKKKYDVTGSVKICIVILRTKDETTGFFTSRVLIMYLAGPAIAITHAKDKRNPQLNNS